MNEKMNMELIKERYPDFYRAEKTAYFGKIAGDKFYLDKPEWSCGWYWSFGTLSYNNGWMHLKDFIEKPDPKALRKAFDLADWLDTDEKVWKLLELSRTAYSLINSAEVIGRGGSHICTIPALQREIQDRFYVGIINYYSLPAVFNLIARLQGGEEL